MVQIQEWPIADLASDIDRPDNGDDVQMWWLGQAGFLLQHRGFLIAVDPYLSDSLARKYAGTRFPHRRMMPVPVDPAGLGAVGLVAVSHGHTDHMDPETLEPLARAARCSFIVPAAECAKAVERGVPEDRLIGMVAGQSVSPVAGVVVTAVPSAHEELRIDGQGRHFCLGYAIEIGGIIFYHSGDTVDYPGLAEALRSRKVDVTLLPINGRDAERTQNGVPGNLTIDEALALSEAAGASLMFGHHYGMFDFNTVAPATARAALDAHAGRCRARLVETGRRYVLTAGA